MSREFPMPEFSQYMLMHEMQPADQNYPYLHHLHPPVSNNQIAAPAYEMTAVTSAGNACAEGSLPSGPSASQNHLDPRKRKNAQYIDYDMSDGRCSGSERSVSVSSTRKRKSSSFGTASDYNDDCFDDSRSSRTNSTVNTEKKQNHSEIEKRRRDKMNTYITELSAMVPMCGAMARKLDKLTVLRMAVQHLRTVRGSLSTCPLTARPRPAFVSERELNSLILQAASDSFLIVVGCDRGRLLYVSHSVSKTLHYDQSELLGQSMFDILHPKDVAKVKEQLSSSDLSPRERLIDAKTMLPVKADVLAGAQRLCPGARRSFFCRIKCKQLSEQASASVKGDLNATTKHKKNERKYCVVHYTGFLKSWVPLEMERGLGGEDEEHASISCLVAFGRALPDLAPSPPRGPAPAPLTRRLQYVSRHAIDGKFLFVDQRVTLALGFLPQELLGTSLYEYVSGPRLAAVAHAHKQALLSRNALQTPPYSFRRKDGSLATIQTDFKPFWNPWTKDVECLVANNTVTAAFEDAQQHYETIRRSDLEVQRLIQSQVESHKIGSAIAEETCRASPQVASVSPGPPDLNQDSDFNPSSLVDNILGVEMNAFPLVRNVSLCGGQPAPPRAPLPPPVAPPPVASPPLPPLTIDGNGEAAMAVIMSLLEADAGLGGPVNFSGLPWPLP